MIGYVGHAKVKLNKVSLYCHMRDSNCHVGVVYTAQNSTGPHHEEPLMTIICLLTLTKVKPGFH